MTGRMVGQLSVIDLEWGHGEGGARSAGLSTRRLGAGVGNPVPKACLMPVVVCAAAALSTAAASPATNSRRGGQGGAEAVRGLRTSDAVRLAAWPGAAIRP